MRHNENLAEFLLQNNSVGIEKNKLNLFISVMNSKRNQHNQPNLSSSHRVNMSYSNSIINTEDRPMNRPTTPLSCISSTSNSQIIYYERKSVNQKMKSTLSRKQNVHTTDKLKQMENTNDVFRKGDKLQRTPPRTTSD